MAGATHTLEIDGTGSAAFRRTLSLLLPVFLLAALMIMVADRADASTAGAGVAAAAVTAGGSSTSAGAQLDIRGLVCSILSALRGAFGAFFGGIFDRILVAFGCTAVPSGVVPGGDDNDDDGGDA
jgi:hypothetical protein